MTCTVRPPALPPFAQATSIFDSGWMSRLLPTSRGWLRLERPADTPTSAAFVGDLVTALSMRAKPGVPSCRGPRRTFTETALERLSERAELAVRLQQEFLTELGAEGASRESATASWAESLG